MKPLKDILSGIELLETKGDLSVSIGSIQFDSRQVNAGDLFVAVKGSHVDGHGFIGKAVEMGAVAVVCEEIPENLPSAVIVVRIADSQKMFGKMAASFYGNPSENLKVVGVTGTNGKTTIATLLYHTFTLLGYKVGLISTIKYYVGKDEFHATHTTPDALQIQELMAGMVEAGCTYCFMEVSSHAIDQERISGIKFDGAIFTNLTHDHLDY
ncbi:MAG TPA: Mur ligase family protein, partial [Prolixibacteraceae bacterium]|nr:Mur ligase family protein [Prolixibacteraceae bacterium]